MDDPEQYQLLPCKSCGMYQYFNNSYIDMCRYENFTYNCTNCCEKHSLAQQVSDLKDTIVKLHTRIDSLMKIRDSENSFDKTVLDALSAQFTNLSIAANVPLPTEHITLPPSESFANSTQSANETSIWSNGTNLEHFKDKDLLALSQTSLESISTISNTDNNTNQYYIEDNEDDVLSEKSNEESYTVESVNNSNQDQSSDERANCDYITMFIGDSTIRNVHLKNCSSRDNPNVFKIARHNANIDDLSDTVDFFMDKMEMELLPRVSQIILHANTIDINQRQSEMTKIKYIKFIEKFQQKGVKVIISGPIPHPQCSEEHFSRLLEMNNWLLLLADDIKEFTFINNFDTFWNKPELFRMQQLNGMGETALLENILAKVPKI